MAESPAAPSPLIFTTATLAEASRPAVLRSLVDQGLLPIDPLPDRVPHVELVKWWLPGASILSGSLAGVRQGGGQSDGDELFLGINVTGAGVVRQRREQVALDAGDAVAVDVREGAFTVLRPGPTRMIGVRVSRRALPAELAAQVAPDGPAAGDVPLRRVPARNPALQLLTRYLLGVLDGRSLSYPDLAQAVVRHVTDLMWLALRPADADLLSAGRTSVRTARLAAIKNDIERHLTDSSLTVAALARRHRITPRYLHMLFEDEASTYSRFVLDRRLDLAHHRLRDPRHADRTISGIAHDVGFGDVSYFNRTFRRRFQMAPSEARRTTGHPGR